MVAGLIFGVPVGSAHNFVALWTGSTLSVMIGRYFFREPIREGLFDGGAFAYHFMWRFRWRGTAPLLHQFICPTLHLRLFLATRMESGKINIVGAERLLCPDVCSSRVSKSTTALSRAS